MCLEDGRGDGARIVGQIQSPLDIRGGLGPTFPIGPWRCRQEPSVVQVN